MLRRFSMEKVHPVSTPMIGRSLDVKKDLFRPREEDEEVLGAETPYLSAIGALLYLDQCTRYLKGTIDLCLFFPYSKTRGSANGIDVPKENVDDKITIPYSKTPNNVLVGFADAGYLFDPHKGHSQTGYVSTIGKTTISWRSTKKTLVATSSNHSEIIAIHEAVRECV
ncbi:secreted RxLR effector protein 161-like [Argentina anserina]|uniref:secreted RxLR effector protein 161-like n=1 Tax=Argentina anserina TaxID=57926 RepID=UPI002176685F|nr:secreted RxLR effector protein 161-like [Potentilla anserina]